MKNCFQTTKKPIHRGILLPGAVFAVLAGLFLYGLGTVSAATEGEQLRAVERAVTRAAVQCYAIEGRYPAGLAYLEENYGLVLDCERYIIQYDIFASNIMPSVLVLPRDFDERDGEGADYEAWD